MTDRLADTGHRSHAASQSPELRLGQRATSGKEPLVPEFPELPGANGLRVRRGVNLPALRIFILGH
ncbi:MAG: hypothetical protein R3C24_15280 [Cyanobacteriota/Melainabacteria group bacterium]